MSLKPFNFRCEYLINPLGIDVIKPRLSWMLESEKRGDFQKAYQILVASKSDLLEKDEGDLWDTKKINSDNTIQLEYEGKTLKSRIYCYWKVKVWDKDDIPSDWSEINYWSMGLLKREDWKAKWIGAPPKKRPILIKRKLRRKCSPCPLLRKSFNLGNSASKAVLYVTALGEYVVSINGKRAGDHILSPEWTDYYKRVQYQTYDVSALLEKGENVIGVILGDGWYTGHLGPGIPIHHSYYGVNLRLLLQLEIIQEDGTLINISSDGDWQIHLDGPIRESDHFNGEVYDVNKEILGWDSWGIEINDWAEATVYDSINLELNAQMNEPIRIIKEIEPISINEPEAGIFIFDLGQNIQGFCKISLDSTNCGSSSIITIRHGEMLQPNGTLYTTNLRTAKARDKYIIDKIEKREFKPHFTFHGFRYAEVSGFKPNFKPTIDTLTGCVISSNARQVGAFECSDPTLNKLWNNILWTQIDNLISIPTDCPQRDERMGWMGDAQVFCQTSIFNMDMAAFYTKWIRDIRDSQRNDGRFADFVPYPYNWGPHKQMIGSPGWADAALIVPWEVYLNYDDKRLIDVHYSSAKKFVDYVHSKNPTNLWINKRGFDYGDWLNGDKIKVEGYPEEGAEIPKELFASAFLAQSTEILSKMAMVLGKNNEHKYYKDLTTKIKKEFVKKYVDFAGRIEGDTQAGYALALSYDILPESLCPKAVSHMVKAIEKYDHRISTGFCTTLKLMNELIKGRIPKVAFELLFSRKFPSWFYMIDNGATTMWERWDGWTKERGFQNKWMNSFNHYAYGSVGEYIYRNIIGINNDEESPGFKRVIISPLPSNKLNWVKGHYISIRGKISINWKVENTELILETLIPPNTEAIIKLPIKNVEDVSENGKRIDQIEEIKDININTDRISFIINSGKYIFKIKNFHREY